MSTATADAPVAAPARGKKKLIVLIAIVALVLVGGGVGAMLLLKKKAGRPRRRRRRRWPWARHACRGVQARPQGRADLRAAGTLHRQPGRPRHRTLCAGGHHARGRGRPSQRPDQELHAGHPQQHPDDHCRPHRGRPDGPRRQGQAGRTRAHRNVARAGRRGRSAEAEAAPAAAAADDETRTRPGSRRRKRRRLRKCCRSRPFHFSNFIIQ